jgi:hypothetical protein
MKNNKGGYCMKNLKQSAFFDMVGIIILVFAFVACNKGGSSGSARAQSGGKTINSDAELKAYLDSQPGNGSDKPIRVSMTINDLMLESVADVISSAGKYVSLNITGTALTTIPKNAFSGYETLVSITIPNSVTRIEDTAFLNCKNLTSVTIPNSVTSIWNSAFYRCNLTSITIPNGVTIIGASAFICPNLTSVTFQGTISADSLGFRIASPFIGDLQDKYLAGGIGTYTTTAPVNGNSKWTKQ